MKKILLLVILAMPAIVYSQDKKQLQDSIKNDSYGTNIGWRIKKGDTLRLGIGSMPNHMYAFIYRSPVNAMKVLAAFGNSSTGVHETSDDSYNKVYLRSDQAKQTIVKSVFVNGTKRGGYTVMARVGVGDMANYWIELDNAIQSSEILAPGQLALKQKNNNIAQPLQVVSTLSVADELKKLKALLDDGTLSKEEYDAQKKKLLNQ
jgi:hypothetical protein